MQLQRIYEPKTLVAIIGSIFSLIYLYTAFRGPFELLIHRPLFVLFVLVLVFLTRPLKRFPKLGRVIDGALILLSTFTIMYLILNYERIAYQAGIATPFEIFLSVLLLILLFEAGRRTVGLILPTLAVASIGYALFGRYIPGPLGHGGFSFEDIMGYLFTTPQGYWSLPVGVAASYIIVFVILGAFLMATGTSDVITGIAVNLLGKRTGGPAQVAVVSSAGFGMVSGAGPANVAVTGSFTIPMMKKIGYKPHAAAAIESVASAGGLLMPPVMGAGAFLMVELTGIPYREIIIAAALPAILYYIALALTVYLVARREGLKGLSQEELRSTYPPLKQIARRSFLLIPLIGLVYWILAGIPPIKAAFYSVILTIIIGVAASRNPGGVKKILRSLVEGARNVLPAGIATVLAAVIYSMLIFTGLGVSFSAALVQVSGGNMMVALLMVAAACIILGFAIPATAAYLIVAAIAAPGLEAFGIPTLAAHLFIFYLTTIGTFTPPMGLALYTATAIAGSEWMKTGIEALKLGISALIIPFSFALAPYLLLFGPPTTIALTFILAVIGVFAISVGAQGFLKKTKTIPERIIYIAIGVTLLFPQFINYAPISLLILAALILYEFKTKKVKP